MLQADLRSTTLVNTVAQKQLNSLQEAKFENNALKVIQQKSHFAKKYLQQTIVEMELQQIAESIVRVTKRVAKRRINQ